jgi:hypothetical protein
VTPVLYELLPPMPQDVSGTVATERLPEATPVLN